MYFCMYVCMQDMYVCMYACMCVFMYRCMDVCMCVLTFVSLLQFLSTCHPTVCMYVYVHWGISMSMIICYTCIIIYTQTCILLSVSLYVCLSVSAYVSLLLPRQSPSSMHWLVASPNRAMAGVRYRPIVQTPPNAISILQSQSIVPDSICPALEEVQNFRRTSQIIVRRPQTDVLPLP